MKRLIASTLLLAPVLALAAAPAATNPARAAAPQTTAKAKAGSGAQAKPPAARRPAAQKPAAQKPAAQKPAPQRNNARRAAAAGAAAGGVAGAAAAAAGKGAPAAPAPLDAQALALADLVHTGRIGCELGKHVNVVRDEAHPGYFKVTGSGFNFHMSPVPTSTGAIRLEDTRAGAVWLQIANKSMLMNQKAGQRLADECMSPAQLQVAEAIKKNPLPNLLEGVAGK